MIKAIIFDLDGVIVNSEPVHQHLENEMYRELGLEIPDELKRSIVGTSAIDAWKLISRIYPLDKTPEELLAKGRGRYLEVVKKGGVPLSDGIRDVIDHFRSHDFLLMLASSATSRTIREVLKWHGLSMIFRIFVGGDQVSHSKPDPEIFLKTAKLGNMKPGECLVIEDASNGVKAAKAAGMFCIGYKNDFTGIQDLSAADVIVEKLTAIDTTLVKKIESGRPI